jgi:uncharacterized protein YkwD
MPFAAALTAAALAVAATSAEAGVRDQIISQINSVRSGNHLHAVHFSERLARGAAAWARALVRRNVLEHSSAAVNRGEGEIIEWHTGSRAFVSRTVSEWWNSLEHRRVMLGREYRHAGAGRAVGDMGGRICTIWVVRFAR